MPEDCHAVLRRPKWALGRRTTRFVRNIGAPEIRRFVRRGLVALHLHPDIAEQPGGGVGQDILPALLPGICIAKSMKPRASKFLPFQIRKPKWAVNGSTPSYPRGSDAGKGSSPGGLACHRKVGARLSRLLSKRGDPASNLCRSFRGTTG